jgi:hypothetical protein
MTPHPPPPAATTHSPISSSSEVGFFCVCERESWEEGKEWARGGEGVSSCHYIEEKRSVRE